MRDVLQVFKSPIEVLFKAVTIMDQYFDQKDWLLQIEELHEIGVASILIASKYTELEPLTVELMAKKAAHGKISERAIRLREKDILISVNFEIATPSMFDFNENYLEYFLHLHPTLKGTKETIWTKALDYLEIALLNFRFCFEMKPS